jgi:iron complex outermembrane receptor protein
MDFGEDKLYIYGWVPALPTATVPGPFQTNGMPMYTKSHTTGASAKADIDLTESDVLRVGAEAQFYRLDDWWPPSPDCGPGNCQGGMAPYTFWNIRDGERDRLAAFSEWEAKWNDRWTSLLGVRYERVAMDAGDPAGYNTFMYNAALFAGAFSKRTDNNLDLSALVRYEPSQNLTIEFGAAQKTRSPGLYELYPWSVHPMALEMNNFVGDGNGYLGNPDLNPETARTISFNAGWKSDDGDVAFTIAPYYSRVADYIDVVRRPTSGTDNNATATTQFVKLQYANQKARLYGIDLYAKVPLAKTGIGDFSLSGMLNYTNGKNLDTGDGLYNIMPLNAKVALNQKLDGWDNSLELVMVDDKKDVSAVRNELTLPSYMLVNLRGGYAFNDRWRVDFGVENLFDKNYSLPLGGAYVGEGATMSFNKEGGTVAYNPARTGASGSGTGWGTGVPGPGRSFYLSANYSF